jgi:hypothetical protein
MIRWRYFAPFALLAFAGCATTPLYFASPLNTPVPSGKGEASLSAGTTLRGESYLMSSYAITDKLMLLADGQYDFPSQDTSYNRQAMWDAGIGYYQMSLDSNQLAILGGIGMGWHEINGIQKFPANDYSSGSLSYRKTFLQLQGAHRYDFKYGNAIVGIALRCTWIGTFQMDVFSRDGDSSNYSYGYLSGNHHIIMLDYGAFGSIGFNFISFFVQGFVTSSTGYDFRIAPWLVTGGINVRF